MTKAPKAQGVKTLGIIGHGFVGKAVDHGFSKDIRKLIVDPLYTQLTLQNLIDERPPAAFIAVPTPTLASGKVEDRILFEVVTAVAKATQDILLIVKSTAPPNTFMQLAEIYPKLVYNPEFLTEQNAREDFINPSMHILGGEQPHLDYVEKLYEQHSICAPCPVYKTDLRSASLAKYTINSFLASKVIFFNQLKEIHAKTEATSSWEEFTKMVATDKRIGDSHMRVPGWDNQPGYGGSCFPKDTRGFVYYAKQIFTRFDILEKVVAINNRYRSEAKTVGKRVKYLLR